MSKPTAQQQLTLGALLYAASSWNAESHVSVWPSGNLTFTFTRINEGVEEGHIAIRPNGEASGTDALGNQLIEIARRNGLLP